MLPFWNLAIEPVLTAVRAQRVLEIGALRGETTAKLLRLLGPEAELHVIDPRPQFDPAEHETQFPGRYHFHRGLSLDVLPDLPPVDVALIDGDHNWHTVFNELRLLAATARVHGTPLPVLVLHDVGWPYGRRDLYYAPETIPEAYRQPSARRGMRPGRRELVAKGGLNASVDNALMEGGPRNGVLTALEDFLHEHDEPIRTVTLPVYFGLAVVVEERRLAREPDLAEVLDGLEGPKGQSGLAAIADKLWLGTLVGQQGRLSAARNAGAGAVDRYLDLLAGALAGVQDLEEELRRDYVAICARKGKPVDPDVLRRPARALVDRHRRLEAMRRRGRFAGDPEGSTASMPWTTMGRERLAGVRQALDTIREQAVAGDLVECGGDRGGGAIFLRGYLAAHGLDDRSVFVAGPLRARADGPDPAAADLEELRRGFAGFGLLDERVRFLQGRLPDAVLDAPLETIALLRLGDGLAAAADEVLDVLYARVAIGGVVVSEDGGAPARRAEIDAFRRRHGIDEPLEPAGAGATAWRKLVHRPASERLGPRTLARTPLAPPAPAGAVDLSVVVVFHDMRREAERALHSLSRAYQEGIEDLDYEVVAVENGSAPDQVLGEELVRSFGPEFRYLDLGAEARPSPAHALNRGIAVARGTALALMIDGAHILSPGVLRNGMLGLREHAPAVVATQRMFLGPGVQPDTVADGYDRAYEDRLLQDVAWPRDGYDLFGVSHFAMDRDWFDPFPESNCLFAPRAALEQVGGFDETFDLPGGEFANLDAFDRLAGAPGTHLVTILGEAVFHQVHGGMTSNAHDESERKLLITSYAERYEQLRGKQFRPPREPMYFVGRLDRRSMRSKARWRRRHHAAPPPEGGVPPEPVLQSAELQDEAIVSYWSSLAWRETTWLGAPIARASADLLAYQELVARLRPDRVVVVGDDDAALSRFFASVCAAVGRGRVLAAGGAQPADGDWLSGAPLDAGVVAAAHDLAGRPPSALVVIAGPVPRHEAAARFEAYSPLVPVDGYAILEGTVVGGNPVWPSFGSGPMAVVTAVTQEGRFVSDRALERHGPTFNRRGFLRRVAD